MTPETLQPPEVDFPTLLKNKGEYLVLSNGKSIKEQITLMAQASCVKKINEAYEMNSMRYPEVLEKKREENNRELEGKKSLLERLEGQESPEENFAFLSDYVTRLKITAEYLEQVSTYTDFNEAMAAIDNIDKSLNSVDEQFTAKSSVLKSLKSSFGKIVAQKMKAGNLINTLTTEAVQKKRKSLTNQVDEADVPIISTRVITAPVAEMIPFSSVNEAIEVCKPEDQGMLQGVLALFDREPTFTEFFCFCYAIKENDPDLAAKTAAIRALGSAAQIKFGKNIQNLYSGQIDKYIRRNITKEDLTLLCASKTENEITRRLTGLAKQVEQITGSQDQEKIMRVVLSYWELELNSNDEFLNQRAVLESLNRAVFASQPLSVRFVRSLRWCYPNGEVEIPPTAGDWETLDTEGKQLIRKEEVEIEKLNIFRNKVLEPLIKWNIPVKGITLLSTGDYEMTGPGYGFSEEDPRAQSAREYVEDIKRRLPVWNVFANMPFAYSVQTVKELIQQNRLAFDQTASNVSAKIDAIFRDYSFDYCGYTGQGMEWIIEREDNNRAPFIKWWTWQRSREFTKYKTWFEMTVGWYVSKFDQNTLLVVSGNRASGLPLSKGKQIDEDTTEVGVMSIRLVNDGQVSKDFAAKTQVI